MEKKSKIILTVISIMGLFFVSVSLWSIYLVYENMRDENERSNNFSVEQGETVDKKEAESKNNNVEEDIESIEDANITENNLTKPITEFETRITKKPFGIYITSQNSPVQPERFQGYHTGADVEYEDVANEVGVLSVASGRVVLSKWVSGYGGVIIISHNVNEENILSLYGHLDPDSLLDINSEVERGDRIGVLGDGNTNETDYERKHLHFGIIKGNEINLRGYVNSESELDGWYDPVEFLK